MKIAKPDAKLMKFSLFTVSLLLTSLVSSKGFTQEPSDRLLKKSSAYLTTNKKNLSADSSFNNYRLEALRLGEDSLYTALTFQQFDRRSINPNDISAIELLDELLINRIDIKNNFAEILQRANFSMSNFFLAQDKSLGVNSSLGKYYFGKYLAISKTLKPSTKAQLRHQKRKLRFLVRTKNDSLFYFLKKYSIPKEEENLVLTKWYREIKNYPKELFYASQTSDLLEQLIAYGNNSRMDKADSLYSVLIKNYENKQPLKLHILQQEMAHIQLKNNEVEKAIELYEVSLTFFEKQNDLLRIEESLKPIVANFKAMKEGGLVNKTNYTKKYNDFNKLKEKKQLAILSKHLGLIKKVSALEVNKSVSHQKELEKEIQFQRNTTIWGVIFCFIIGFIIFLNFKKAKERNLLNLKINELKIDILKSKFKPHFMFNVLSVVNYFIAKKDYDNAAAAINKMAGLLRLALKNINQNSVSYESEYEICKYYMFLEEMRFSEKFDFKAEPLLDPKMRKWQIPPGILEPFLENSVNYAFNQKEEKGLITMEHKIQNECLVITLSDNGCGIENKTMSENQSYGLSITQDIVKVASKLYKKGLDLKIKTEKGTKVIITIPMLKSF